MGESDSNFSLIESFECSFLNLVVFMKELLQSRNISVKISVELEAPSPAFRRVV